MYHPLPSFPPLFPSGEWWRLFLASLLERRVFGDAITMANRRSCLRPREWLRFCISGAMTLSLPVEGGASALKNCAPASWRLAPEAVRESRKAASTLSTVYGRQPFFHLLEDDLRISPQPGEGASEVCMEKFGAVCKVLGLEDASLIDALAERVARGDQRLRDIRRELCTDFSPGLSIVDSVVRMGPDAIFSLLPSF